MTPIEPVTAALAVPHWLIALFSLVVLGLTGVGAWLGASRQRLKGEMDQLHSAQRQVQASLQRHQEAADEYSARAHRLETELAHASGKLAQGSERIDQLAAELAESRRAVAMAEREQSRLREELARRSEAQRQTDEKLQLLTEAREGLGVQFRQLANEIFDAKQQAFGEQNRERLSALLDPLKERIGQFEKRVEETYDRESKERFSLTREIHTLRDLNTRIGDEANNLTRALKGQNKAQGTWGEVVLERVLERSGLVRGREYEIQLSGDHQTGRRGQPDVVVHLPEGRDLVIDSKVSLLAYERYVSTDEEAERGQQLKALVQSLRTHMRSLSDKDYPALHNIRSLDFVLLFLPIEHAFTLAVEADPSLFGDAFDHNIVIVGPSTLLATLKTIHNIWRYEHQSRNAQEIARQAGALYDKFVGFVVDLDEVDRRLVQSRDAFDRARNKLSTGRGNLVARSEKLRELGASAKKRLSGDQVALSKGEDDTEGDAEPEAIERQRFQSIDRAP